MAMSRVPVMGKLVYRFKRWFGKVFLGYVECGVTIEEIECPDPIPFRSTPANILIGYPGKKGPNIGLAKDSQGVTNAD